MLQTLFLQTGHEMSQPRKKYQFKAQIQIFQVTF
jgi:hypothetical protein